MKPLFVATLFALFFLPSCSEDPAKDTTLPAGKPAIAKGSVYDLTSEWRDQDNNKIALSDLGDKVRVIVMGYTSCKFACPRLIADLIAIENGLKDDPVNDEVAYSFISIDPESDTPATLKKLESQYKFTATKWKIITGDEDGVLELAVALGMKYRKTSPIDFAHSNIITVLRRDGSIAYQQVGLGADKTKTFDAIRAAAKAN